jgi:hypothetical protein
MPGVVCEICRFHQATQHVTIIEGGRRREVPVCDVHRRLALAGSEASTGRKTMLVTKNNLHRRKAPACSN